MTTQSANATPSRPAFHVRSGGATARGVVITAIWLTLVVGFVAQLMNGVSPRNSRDQQATAGTAAVQLHG